MIIDSVPDVFRLLNVALGIVCAGLVTVTRGAAWRNADSTLKLFTLAIGGFLAFQAYAGIEVILLQPEREDNGVRVYGITFWLTMTLVALVIERRRARNISWAENARAAFLKMPIQDRIIAPTPLKGAVNDPHKGSR